MTKRTSFQKIFEQPLWLGITVAVLFIIWKLILFITNNQHQVLESFPIAPLFVLLAAAIIYKQWSDFKKAPSQYDHLQGFKSGALVALIAAVTVFVLIWLFYSYVNPDFLEILKTKKLQQVSSTQWKGKQLENYIKMTNTIFQTKNWALFTLSSTMIIGFVYALIVSLFVKFILKNK